MSATRRLLTSLALAAGLGALVLQRWIAWPCPLRMICGLPCPTCGMTRAARLAMGGHFGDATRMHPLWFVVLPIVAGLVAIELAAYVRSGAWGTTARVTQRRDVRLLMHVTLAAVMLLWIARFLGAFGGPVAALERF